MPTGLYQSSAKSMLTLASLCIYAYCHAYIGTSLYNKHVRMSFALGKLDRRCWREEVLFLPFPLFVNEAKRNEKRMEKEEDTKDDRMKSGLEVSTMERMDRKR